MRATSLFLAVLFISSSAFAQQWSDVNTVNPIGYVSFPLDNIPVSSFNPNVLASGCDASHTNCGTVGIDIQDFAETSTLNSDVADIDSQVSSLSTNTNIGLAAVNSQIGALSTSVDAKFSAINSQMAAMNANLAGLKMQVSQMNVGLNRANQLAVIAGALKDAVPNDGDRFAVRLNMAAWNSVAAGSVAVSVNVTNKLRLSVDYGRSQNQNMFSAGLNMSFN